MPRKTLELQFPAAGVIRRTGLRAGIGGRGPFPAPWATNVRLEEGIANRLRGGSFTAVSADARPSETRYRDRLLTFSTNAITATRMGDDTDTTLSSDVSDTMRPALFQLSYGGATGGTVLDLIPHKDRFLLGFTADETWVQHGDPHTGPRQRISDEVGLMGANAWCVKDDMAYFLSSRGLYSVGMDGSGLKAVSEDRIPEELTGVTDSTTLTYNHADRGVYIHISDADVSWFYDTERDQFWPFSTASTDSHVLLGPFLLGQNGGFGRVVKIEGTVAQSSANVLWSLVTADSAEEAAANGKLAIQTSLQAGDASGYVQGSGTWTAGHNHAAYPRTRAVAAVLWLRSTGTWAFESASMTAIASGRWR